MLSQNIVTVEVTQYRSEWQKNGNALYNILYITLNILNLFT